MFRSKKSINKDAQLEKIVLEKASGVITTIGGDFHKKLFVFVGLNSHLKL